MRCKEESLPDAILSDNLVLDTPPKKSGDVKLDFGGHPLKDYGLDSPKMCRPPEPGFWATAKLLNKIVEQAPIQTEWNHSAVLGETNMEIYESIYLMVASCTEELIRKGVQGFFWIATTPEIALAFETMTAGFAPHHRSPWSGYHAEDEFFGYQTPLGLDSVEKRGTVNNRWCLLSCGLLTKDTLIIGANNTAEVFANYAVITFKDKIFRR